VKNQADVGLIVSANASSISSEASSVNQTVLSSVSPVVPSQLHVEQNAFMNVSSASPASSQRDLGKGRRKRNPSPTSTKQKEEQTVQWPGFFSLFLFNFISSFRWFIWSCSFRVCKAAASQNTCINWDWQYGYPSLKLQHGRYCTRYCTSKRRR